VFIGTLLPFGPAVVSSMMPAYDEEDVAALDADNPVVRKNLADGLGNADPAMLTDTAAASVGYEHAGRPGFETFLGALFLMFALLCIVQMWTAIRDRKVALGGVLLLFIPAGWAWFKLFTVTGDVEGFSWGNLVNFSHLEGLALHLGSGFLLVLLGGTFVVLNFVFAMFGAAKGGKPAAAPAAARGRTRRRS